jgi:hypothetical protein
LLQSFADFDYLRAVTKSFLMKRALSFFIIFLLLLASCRSIKDSDLKAGRQNHQLLPPLEIRIDLTTFHFLRHNPYLRAPESSLEQTFQIDTAIYISSLGLSNRSIDIATIFEREVLQSITHTGGENMGYIVCKLTDGQTRMNFAWAVASGLLLGIPNLFGMPAGRAKTQMTVEVDIYDKHRKLIGRYNAPCTGRAAVAFYYGYSEFGPLMRESNVYRKAAIRAFSCAMQDIKKQIELDFDRLNTALQSDSELK